MSEKNGTETPTERLLREALSARAAAITPHDLRPAQPPSRRLRRLRPVHLVTTVVMFGLAASIAGYFTLSGTPTAMHQDPAPAASLSSTPTAAETPTPTSSPSPSPSGDVPAAPGAGESSRGTRGPAATPHTFRNVTYQLPAGWRTSPENDGSVRLCLVPPNAPGDFGTSATGCLPQGVQIAVWNSAEELGGSNWPSDSFLDARAGWSNQPFCFAGSSQRSISESESATYGLVGEPKRTVVEVDGRYANKTQWQVACNAKEQFTAQMWGFHKEQVFVAANGLSSDYQDDLEAIVNSLDLSKHADPLKLGHGNDIKVTFGQEEAIRVGDQGQNEIVTVPVTWTNVSSTSYSAVEPVVAADYVENQAMLAENPTGPLDRLDGAGSARVPLRQSADTSWQLTGQAAAFALAPGQSRTIIYQMKLTVLDNKQSLGMTGAAFLSKGRETPTSVGTVHSQVPIHRVKP
ncbi:hypothetical protein [Kitasatospora sp. NPDC002040]|uniref:hypothetical protein n=1 Tax=Kitasatospora sp. NPDC002040 TaxID=3154661 RepID=UPI00332511EC